MDNQLTYIGYTRKSSEDNEDRQIASNESQKRELEETKVKQNLNVSTILQESKSAHKIGRKVFNYLLEQIEEGKANAILTWHPNRLTRNPFDAGKLIYLMDEEKLVEIRTPTRVFRNTPEDKFMLNLEFGMSKKDSDDKGIAVKRGLKEKVLAGWRPGVAPEGYLNDKISEHGERKIFTDLERFPFIKKIFELKYQGTSVKKICQIAKDEWHYLTRPKKRLGNKPLTVGMIYWILTNSFYCGRYEYPIGSGEWHEGRHERVVEPEIFDQIQIMLGRKGKAKPKTHEFAFTGLMRCPCGSMITAEEKYQVICTNCKVKFALTTKNSNHCPNCQIKIEDMANPTILHYIYYHCSKKKDSNCIQRSIEVKELERQISDKLSRIAISERFMNWAIKQINAEGDSERYFREDKIKSLQRAHDQCRQKLDNLLNLKISPLNTDGGLISDEKYKTEKGTLERELKDMETHLSEIDERMVKTNNELAEKFDFSCRAKMRFATGDLATQREILEDLGSNPTIRDKILDLEVPFFYQKLEEMKNYEPTIGPEVEPNKKPIPAGKLETLWASNQSLLRD